MLEQAYNEDKRRCLLFVGETGEGLVIERFGQLIKQADERNIGIVSLQEDAALDLDSKEGSLAMLRYIKEFKADIVCIDSLMSFRQGDENKSQDTNTMCKRLQFMAKASNTAILISHHLRKTDKRYKVEFDQDEIIGSSALTRNAGTAFVLLDEGGVKTLRCVKSWWKKPEDLRYIMVESEGKMIFRYAPIPEELTGERLRVEKFLRSHAGTGYQISAIAEACNVSESTVRRVVTGSNEIDRRQGMNHVNEYGVGLVEMPSGL